MFLMRMIDVCNSLPASVVHTSSVNAFARRLDKFWKNQGIEYKFEEAFVSASTPEGCQPELEFEDNCDLYIEV